MIHVLHRLIRALLGIAQLFFGTRGASPLVLSASNPGPKPFRRATWCDTSQSIRSSTQSLVAVAGSVLLIFCASTIGQVTRSVQHPDQFDVVIPERVDVAFAQLPVVQTRVESFPTEAAAGAAIPRYVPVWTVTSEWRVRGFYMANTADGSYPTHHRPLSVSWIDGAYRVQVSDWSVPPEFALLLSQSEDVEVVQAERIGTRPRDRGPWTLNLFLDPAIRPLIPAGQAAGIDQALARISARFQALISDAGGPVNMMFTFAVPPAGMSLVCGTAFPTGPISRAYPNLRDDLETFADAQDEPGAERAIYQSLTPALGIQFLWNSPTPTVPVAASNIRMPQSLARKFFVATPDPLDALIVCDPSPPPNFPSYDLDPTNGVTAGQLDFDGAVTHELCHALGFNCGIDFAAPGVQPDLFALDLYHLEADVGPTVDSNEMFTRPRMLRRDVEAVSGLLLGIAAGVCPMSRGNGAGGDGRQASHWKAGAVDAAGRPLGIMLPTTRLGPSPGSALSNADILGLDIIGWNIPSVSGATAPAGPQPAQLLQPADQAIVGSLTPTLTWTTDGSEERIHVAVFRMQGALEIEQVFFASDLIGVSSISLPAGALAGGQQYGWHITSENFLGFAYGFSVFSTQPACPADVNHDGIVSLQDLFDFLGAWFANCGNTVPLPGSCNGITGDFNGASGVTLQDLFDFLSAWFAGC